MDLSTTIAGVRFSSCFMNASGALCVTREELLACAEKAWALKKTQATREVVAACEALAA